MTSFFTVHFSTENQVLFPMEESSGCFFLTHICALFTRTDTAQYSSASAPFLPFTYNTLCPLYLPSFTLTLLQAVLCTLPPLAATLSL